VNFMSDEKIPLPPKIQLPPKIGNVPSANPVSPSMPNNASQASSKAPMPPSAGMKPPSPQLPNLPTPEAKIEPPAPAPQPSSMPAPTPQPSSMPAPAPQPSSMPAPAPQPAQTAPSSFADDDDDDDVSGIFLSEPVKKMPTTTPAFNIDADGNYDSSPKSFGEAVGGIQEPKPRVEMLDDGSDYYNEEEYEPTGDYYNTNSNLVISRGNWFLKIFKPVAWLGLVSGIIAAGVFAAPFLFDWFNENFEGEEIIIEQPTETPSAPIVEGGEGIIAPTEDATAYETYSYNPEITGTSVGVISQDGVLPEGNSGIISYTTEPAGDAPLQLTVQLDSVTKTEQFASVLRGIKTASLGEAAAQGVDLTEAEQQLENYRLNFVKINVRYDGEPLTFNRPQLFGTVSVNDVGKIGADVSENVLSYYVGPLGLSQEDAYAKIFEDFQCNMNPNFDDNFWNGGVSVQKCFIVASNDSFTTTVYSHRDYSMKFQNTYRE
jgi:hypothetical protein